MKIVHLCLSCFYIDDYSYQENMLPKYHVLQGHDVTVIASLVSFNSDGQLCQLPEESVKEAKDGYKVVRVDYKKPFYKLNRFIRRYNNVYKLLENEKPDIIFLHDFSFADVTKVIKYVKKNKDVKVFSDCHTDYINSAQTWFSKNIFHHLIWRYYGSVLSKYTERFFGVTPLRCDFLRDAYKIEPKKIELLVMGVDDELLKTKDRIQIWKDYSEKLNIASDDFIIVTGGKIDIKKNIHLVLEAVTKLKNKKIKLIVFGTISSEIKELFDKLLLNEYIIFVGWQNADTILDYFILADLIIFPGTHSVLWEQAVGVGTPSLFKYWEGMEHVNVGGNCEFLYNDSADEIASVVKKIVEEEGRYEMMKKIAMTEGLRHFSYSEIAKRAITL